GQMQYGQQHINSKWYLFDQNTGAMKTGFQYIANQNKIVYYDSQGRMLYGSQTINGKSYNLNTATGALTTVDAIGLKLAAASFADKTSQTVVTVASGSKASVYLYSKDKNGIWYRSLSTSGFVGSSGVGKASEGSSTTPIGAYSLGMAFGTHASVNTSLAYRQIDSKSYWIEDVDDSDYNTWQERSWANSKNEHLADYPTQYEYAIVINYNTSQRTKGAGSGFFLHVANGRATAGCVSVPRSVILQLLSTLKSGAYIVNVNNVNQISNY
ncbi:L,D-transpeptidase family protein, partial [Liquorilactobacillus uvarum]